jgi:integrase
VNRVGLKRSINSTTRKRGLPLSDRAIKKLIQDISETAKVEFSCQWLGHSHATRAVESKPLFQVQDQLGHSKSDTTKGYVRSKKDAGTGTVLPKFGLKMVSFNLLGIPFRVQITFY